MRTYWNTIGGLTTIKEWEPNCWIQVTCPTEEDQLMLEKQFNIPDYFMSDISDTDERARYEYDDGWMLIILRIPYVKEIRSRTPYTTVPLGIIQIDHAGLECSIILGKYPHLDVVSLGPTIKSPHTTDERALIATVEPFWKLLKQALEEIYGYKKLRR